MTQRRAKSITIVGGGTSAWLTAALLNHNIKYYKEIYVIDKEIGTPIGVGEATILSFKSFMDDCGFHILDWFKEVSATFKGGIRFENWLEDGKDIWHPFAYPDFPNHNTNLISCWTNCQDLDFKTHSLVHYNAHTKDKKIDPDNLGIYSFHLDAGLLVDFVRKKVLENGVTFIQSEVKDVIRDENGYVVELILNNGQIHKSDLFVDCTGFNGLLKEKNHRVDLTDRLFVDTAVCTRVEYVDIENELNPYTVCDAVDHGWIWKVPVSTRIGSGLVFNRSVTDIEEAKKYFVEYWNNRITIDQLRVLDWTPFYNTNFWEKNVVSVGISAGFIEPLESTGIALICAGAWGLLNRIKTTEFDSHDIDFYNAELKCFFENSIDFINMHYMKPKSKGKFWQFVKNTYKPTEKLDYYINELKTNTVDISNAGKEMFSSSNWSCWLIQLGYEVCPKVKSQEISRVLLEEFYLNEDHKYDYLPKAHVFNKHFSELPFLSKELINPYKNYEKTKLY